MKHYAICNEDFSEMQQEMSRIEDTCDTIVPCTQYLVQQDVAEGNQDLHPDYRHLVQMLNKEQKEFF